MTQYFDVEVTDTFGGEANYCWVHRHMIEVPDNSKDRTIVKAAKAIEGWTGLKCETESCGDSFTLRPRGLLQVMFITWRDTGIHPIEVSNDADPDAPLSETGGQIL